MARPEALVKTKKLRRRRLLNLRRGGRATPDPAEALANALHAGDRQNSGQAGTHAAQRFRGFHIQPFIQ